MAYWDGTRWVPEIPDPPLRRRTHRSRLLGAAIEASLLVLLVFGLVTSTALAGKGGHGSRPHATSGACTVDGDVVSATGLPTDEVINFMVSDADGTRGWVLGFTADGTWSVTAPPRSGATLYEFTSRTFGSNGSKYRVYASCSHP